MIIQNGEVVKDEESDYISPEAIRARGADALFEEFDYISIDNRWEENSHIIVDLARSLCISIEEVLKRFGVEEDKIDEIADRIRAVKD